MSRLPTNGGDNNVWGSILNDYLSVSHAADGTLNVGVVTNTQLNTALQNSISLANTALQSVTASSVGLGNVNNTSDANKPISTATQTALNGKITGVGGAILNDAVVTQAQMNTLLANGTTVATTRYTIVG